MTVSPISSRIAQASQVLAPLLGYFLNSAYAERKDDPSVADFAFGNPQEMPLPGFVQALQTGAVPQNKDWFSYKNSEPAAQEIVAQTLQSLHQIPFAPEDILMTNGAFAGLAVCLAALVDPGDEVIYISPPWFFYESMIVAYGGTPVRVRIDPATLDLDLTAIAQAITPRTRAIIVNSPNNPTGKIYPPETLAALGELLTAAGRRQERPIFLLSDEAYSRIPFDGRSYPSPTRFYPHSLLIYTYGKTLLTPGQRLGYIAIPPANPAREELQMALFATQALLGWAWPNALLQHALPEIEKLSIDVEHLQAKRDRMVAGLQAAGYSLHSPEGTFYLLVRSPWEDDLAFSTLLAEHDILVLPGSMVEMPGHFRISLTANDQMIEQALPKFAAALRRAAAEQAPAG